MSNHYSIAQVRDNISQIVQEVENGTSVEITDEGKSVAVMISIDEYNRLVASNSGFWKALLKFREEVDSEEEEIEPEIFEGVRDTSPGREVVW